MLKVTVSGLSDIGRVREENQDALLIHEPTDREVLRKRGVLVALADGMGGLEGGSLASRLAVDAALKHYYNDPAEPRVALENAAKEANQAIFRHANEVEGGQQMGSTLTALAVLEDEAIVAQVGDSRAYCYREGTIRQVTRDHSLVRELVDRGEIDEGSLQYNSHRNILTRGLGLREEVSVDVYELKNLSAGDTILLSSDGMHGLVQEDEMAACLEKFGADVQSACRELVEVARDRGGPDNITVALVHMEAADPAEARDGPRVQKLRLERVGPSRAWMLPFLVFFSFALGTLLTLFVENAANPTRTVLEELRDEATSALETSKTAGTEAERARRLEAGLEKIRKRLEGWVPPDGQEQQPGAGEDG